MKPFFTSNCYSLILAGKKSNNIHFLIKMRKVERCLLNKKVSTLLCNYFFYYYYSFCLEGKIKRKNIHFARKMKKVLKAYKKNYTFLCD